jgi:hypothetical protein
MLIAVTGTLAPVSSYEWQSADERNAIATVASSLVFSWWMESLKSNNLELALNARC